MSLGLYVASVLARGLVATVRACTRLVSWALAENGHPARLLVVLTLAALLGWLLVADMAGGGYR